DVVERLRGLADARDGALDLSFLARRRLALRGQARGDEENGECEDEPGGAGHGLLRWLGGFQACSFARSCVQRSPPDVIRAGARASPGVTRRGPDPGNIPRSRLPARPWAGRRMP